MWSCHLEALRGRRAREGRVIARSLNYPLPPSLSLLPPCARARAREEGGKPRASSRGSAETRVGALPWAFRRVSWRSERSAVGLLSISGTLTTEQQSFRAPRRLLLIYGNSMPVTSADVKLEEELNGRDSSRKGEPPLYSLSFSLHRQPDPWKLRERLIIIADGPPDSRRDSSSGLPPARQKNRTRSPRAAAIYGDKKANRHPPPPPRSRSGIRLFNPPRPGRALRNAGKHVTPHFERSREPNSRERARRGVNRFYCLVSGPLATNERELFYLVISR